MFKVGDIIRYGRGETALMKITEESPNHGGPGLHRYYGLQYYGGPMGAWLKDCSAATERDLELWRREHPECKNS